MQASEMNTTVFIGKTISKPRSSSQLQAVPRLLHPYPAPPSSLPSPTLSFSLGTPFSSSHIPTEDIHCAWCSPRGKCKRMQSVEYSHCLPKRVSNAVGLRDGKIKNNCSGRRPGHKQRAEGLLVKGSTGESHKL